MYKIIGLNKFYKSKKEEVHALKDINITLEDKGMIFVSGASGSGKSTFLNCLGGLDTFDSGDLYFNDINLKYLSEKEKTLYRNKDIGFIFQDFALIETMNVIDNITLSLEMQNKSDNLFIDNILKGLGIYELKYRKINELSTGQKQRVSIARAVVKKPKVILADEPTGNLDDLSSELVLKYLKEISKNILVLIVSHNLNDAYEYASRIIKVEKGEIVEDKYCFDENRNFLIKDNILYLNDIERIDYFNLDLVYERLASKEIRKIRSSKDLFIENIAENKASSKKENNNKRYKDKNYKMNHKNSFKLFKNILKNQSKKQVILSFVSMIIISLMSVCSMFINFSGDNIIEEELKGDSRPQVF